LSRYCFAHAAATACDDCLLSLQLKIHASSSIRDFVGI
jgi:hypothetical protein